MKYNLAVHVFDAKPKDTASHPESFPELKAIYAIWRARVQKALCKTVLSKAHAYGRGTLLRMNSSSKANMIFEIQKKDKY